MSNYSKIDRQMWGDKKFRALSTPAPNAQTLWQYLLTGPHNRIVPGLFSVTVEELAIKLRWPLEATAACFGEIEALQMVRTDRVSQLMWLPNALRHNLPRSPNVVVGWHSWLSELPECPLKDEAVEFIRHTLAAVSQAYKRAISIALGEVPFGPSTNPSGKGQPKTLPKTLPKTSVKNEPKTLPTESPKTLPIQEQEQEQEDEERPPESSSTFSGHAEPRCPTVEHPNRLDPDEILNALNRSSGGVVDIRGTGPVQQKFFAGIHEARWTLDEIENLGRYLAAGECAWANRKRFDLGWFLFNDTRLGELVTKAIEWAESNPEHPPIAPPVLVRIVKPDQPPLSLADLSEQARTVKLSFRGHRG
jgi:hypothetical protein